MKNLLILTIVLIAFTSCEVGYVANSVHTPMFEEKGQFTANVNALVTLDVQAAYAVSDNLFVHTDASLLPPGEEGTGGLSSSIGLGYYKNEGRSLFEFTGGLGFGVTDDYYGKVFIQPTWAKRTGLGEAGFSTRILYAIYDSPDIPGNDLFVEPVGTFRFGKNKFMFQTQVGLSMPVYYRSDLGWVPIIMNIGLHMRI